MKRNWQLQEAKARLSELVRAARTDGPQEISVHGQLAVVVLSAEEFQRLSHPRPSFVEFLRSSPLAGAGLRLGRDKSPARDVDL